MLTVHRTNAMCARTLSMHLFFALLAFVLIGGAAIPATTTAPTVADDRACDPETGETADQLFHAAERKWSDSYKAQDLVYQIVVSVTEGSETIVRHYDGNLQDDLITVLSFSTEEQANPITPHGINVYITLGGQPVMKLSSDGPTYDLIGVPKLSPRYSFGLSSIRVADEANVDNQPGVAPLRTIATTAARARIYEATCAGSELAADGRRLNQLQLRPLIEPKKYRLRALTIESGNYWAVEAKVHGNFEDGPPLDSDWAIEFGHDLSGEFIREEDALGVLEYGRHRYSHVRISFENVSRMPRDRAYLRFDVPDSGQHELIEPR